MFLFLVIYFYLLLLYLVWGMNVVWTMRSGMYMHNEFNILYADDNDDQKTLAEELSGGV